MFMVVTNSLLGKFFVAVDIPLAELALLGTYTECMFMVATNSLLGKLVADARNHGLEPRDKNLLNIRFCLH